MSPADADPASPAARRALSSGDARDALVVPVADGVAPAAEACPGCGAVLVVVPGLTSRHPGAAPSCSGLFDVTMGGLREEATADVQTAGMLQLATDTYAAQHLLTGQPAGAVARLCLWVARGLDPHRVAESAERVTAAAPATLARPDRWTTTIADVAADLDVVDLPALVRSWAEAVWTDWSPAHGQLCAAADEALARAT